MTKRKTPEGYVMAAVEDYLSVKGHGFIRCNAGDIFGEKNGQRWRIKLHEPGTADFLAFREIPGGLDGCPFKSFQLIWIECKAPNGSQSPVQRDFERRKRAEGHRYILCYGIDDLVAAGL